MGVYIGQSTRIYDRETGEITTVAFRRGLWLFQVICRQKRQIQPLLCGYR